MTHAETVATHLYPLYCDYIEHINQSANLRGERLADISVVSQPDFLAIWNTLPESRRDFWQRRFEAGYDEVADLERRKLVAAFTSNDLNHAEFNAVARRNVTCSLRRGVWHRPIARFLRGRPSRTAIHPATRVRPIGQFAEPVKFRR